MERSSQPAWAAGLPRRAVPPPSQIPPLEPRKRMSFEHQWRALTIERLYGHHGWTLKRIATHFGFGPARARQLVRLGGWYGKRGGMVSVDPTTWPTVVELAAARRKHLEEVPRLTRG